MLVTAIGGLFLFFFFKGCSVLFVLALSQRPSKMFTSSGGKGSEARESDNCEERFCASGVCSCPVPPHGKVRLNVDSAGWSMEESIQR